MSDNRQVIDQEVIKPPSSEQLCVDGIVRGTIKANKDCRKDLQPEMFMWAAVIRKAVEDLETRNLRDEALRWLLSNEFSTGSLLWICEQLSLSGAEVRKLATVPHPCPLVVSPRHWNKDRRPSQMRDAAGFDIGGVS